MQSPMGAAGTVRTGPGLTHGIYFLQNTRGRTAVPKPCLGAASTAAPYAVSGSKSFWEVRHPAGRGVGSMMKRPGHQALGVAERRLLS